MNKFTELEKAIRENLSSTALKLIEELDHDEFITRLLHNAIFYKNSIEVCAALLNKMTVKNIHGLNQYKCNALHIAVDSGDIEICKLLLTKMEPNVVNQLNIHARAPLFFAAYDGKLEICKLLLPLMDKDVINLLDNRGINKEGKNCLMWAAEEGHKEICKLLAEYVK